MQKRWKKREMKRLDNETYEEYKKRMKEYNRIMSVDFNRHVPYGISRDQYFQIFEMANLELKAARANGYTDEEILESMKQGNESHNLYGVFIENEILKRG